MTQLAALWTLTPELCTLAKMVEIFHGLEKVIMAMLFLQEIHMERHLIYQRVNLVKPSLPLLF